MVIEVLGRRNSYLAPITGRGGQVTNHRLFKSSKIKGWARLPGGWCYPRFSHIVGLGATHFHLDRIT